MGPLDLTREAMCLPQQTRGRWDGSVCSWRGLSQHQVSGVRLPTLDLSYRWCGVSVLSSNVCLRWNKIIMRWECGPNLKGVKGLSKHLNLKSCWNLLWCFFLFFFFRVVPSKQTSKLRQRCQAPQQTMRNGSERRRRVFFLFHFVWLFCFF